MDHVLSKGELEEYADHILEIPWLGYDHQPSTAGDFDDYALQRGWDRAKLQDLKEGRLGNVDRAVLKPFLQSWFGIGLWEMALGRGLDKDLFVSRKGSTLLFTSEPLRQIIKDMQTQFRNLPRNDHGKIQMLERCIKVLASANIWNRMLGDASLFIDANPQFCDESYESIMRLFTLSGMTLQCTGEHLAMYVEGSFRSRMANPWESIPANEQSLRVRLVKRGWCPYIRELLSPFHRIVVEYAAIIGPPSTHFAHDLCSTGGCVRHNIDESTYKPMHTKPDCQCTFVRPKIPKIADILDNGGIPLVDFAKITGTEEAKSIEVVPFEEGKSMFTAVSHVWSGGLGSVSEEGLPKCAVDFLASYIQPTKGSKLVWIDSLCIPRQKRLRKLCIKTLNRNYSSASTTLVLDPELMHTNSTITRRTLLWVITSAWMQRMWTLPEGRLSKLPFFAFKDGVVLLQRLLKDAEDNDIENSVTGALMTDLFGLFLSELNTLRFVHQSLCFRTTSKREDEVPALAALFNIDAHHILETISLDERMAIFWLALREKVSLPMNVLFLKGPKLQIPGLRWAPSSLLNAGRQLSLMNPPKGVTAYNVQLGENGTLTATYIVILLERRSNLLLGSFNPIRLAIAPDPGSENILLAPFTILATQSDAYKEAGKVLEDIDAFAVNVTKREARTALSLMNELMAGMKFVIALTTDRPNGRSGEDKPSDRAAQLEETAVMPGDSHSFRARCRLRLSPTETRGNDLPTGYVGWTKISIS